MSARNWCIPWASLVLILALAACRPGAAGPTPQPSHTPTPMSTPLPTLPPTLEAGAAENPIHLIIARGVVDGEAADAATALEAYLTDSTNLSITVELVESDRDAVTALCDSFAGSPAVAWVSGPGYSAARALGCSHVMLIGEGDGGEQTREITLIAPADSEITSLAGLSEASFCRLSSSDLNSWQAPALLMLAAGLQPTDVLTEITDVADLDSLVEQVAAGDCDLGALATADLDRIERDVPDAELAQLPETLDLPLGVMLAAPELPLGAREALTDALIEWARTDEDSGAWASLTGTRGLALPTTGSLSDWDALIEQTGLQFDDFNG